MPQTTRHPAGEHTGQIDELVGDLAGVHQVGGQQKEWHGQKDEGIIGLEHTVQQDERGQPQVHHHDGHGGEAERKGDGHAQHDKKKKAAHEDRAGHSG